MLISIQLLFSNAWLFINGIDYASVSDPSASSSLTYTIPMQYSLLNNYAFKYLDILSLHTHKHTHTHTHTHTITHYTHTIRNPGYMKNNRI